MRVSRSCTMSRDTRQIQVYRVTCESIKKTRGSVRYSSKDSKDQNEDQNQRVPKGTCMNRQLKSAIKSDNFMK